MKKKETIEIPISLAKILAAESEDMKNPEQWSDAQQLAKQLLRLLMVQ